MAEAAGRRRSVKLSCGMLLRRAEIPAESKENARCAARLRVRRIAAMHGYCYGAGKISGGNWPAALRRRQFARPAAAKAC